KFIFQLFFEQSSKLSMMIHRFLHRQTIGILILVMIGCSDDEQSKKIDRYEVVSRHNIQLDTIDTLSSLSVGNGEFAYTVDITGMQTFPEAYENGVSLGTQSQWGWHTIPNEENYELEDVAVNYESCNDQSVPYAVQHQSGRAAEAANWLRANPHRLHLGVIGLILTKENGYKVQLSDIQNATQKLDLWTGSIESNFELDGIPVKVATVSHQEMDMVSFRISSPLINSDRLKIKFGFPYGKECHVCPGYDWEQEDKHRSAVIKESSNFALIHRTLDSTNYFVGINWNNEASLIQKTSHHFQLKPSSENNTIELSVYFSPAEITNPNTLFNETAENSQQQWKNFWNSGGAIDFSECTDPRANELERRVVLSQYLMKIQCSGSQPPQETGLTFNSWYGKFHIEMHWWHVVHFALWGRPQYLENAMNWYFENLENARKTAQWQNYDGARWPKMTTPLGQSSPSNVGEFLVWQQPHIIYFAELFYRANPSKETLEKYRNLVFETADFMASFAQLNQDDGLYHLCPPLIPAQEHFKATETSDPAFELSYWDWGLKTAQKWRERLNLEKDKKWQDVIDHLAPLPQDDSYYLPTREAADAFSNFEKRRDHPIVVGAYGFLPNDRIDKNKMEQTFMEVMNKWNWQSTWGWDYPLLAMSATRIGRPEMAIDALFTDTQKNTYLINGHNYQSERLRIYLPGNGGLLAAVAMMSAGFEGSEIKTPGFPKDGKWEVKWEGLKPIL
ncbi:MAG TPA: hypothetical protein VK994_00545, partial [Bacteroidales bacterium]|nr:hypothetical protein [Bacteroidales bacterium]